MIPNWKELVRQLGDNISFSKTSLRLQPLVLVSCHAAVTAEKTQPARQEPKLIKKKKKGARFL